MTEFIWKITKLFTVQQPEPNYIVEVEWIITGKKNGTEASIKDSTKLNSEKSSVFVPYDNLTEEIVIEWVKEVIGKQAIENYKENVESKIDSILKPKESLKETPLPWVSK